MGRGKDPFWNYAKDLKNGRFSCNFCNRNFAGGNSRIKAHLSGVRGRDIQICDKVPETIQLQARDAVPPTKRTKNMVVSSNILVGECISSSSSGQDKITVDQQLVKFLVSEGIHPSAIESPFFINFVNGVVEHGPSYKLPHSLTITSELAPNIKKEVDEYIENVMKESIKTGCTLMYKIRYCKKLLIDIYAYTPIGVVCIKTLMKPSNMNVVKFLRSETALSSVVEFIETTNIVQFIIDDEDDKFEPTKDVCCRKYPLIYWTRSVANDIQLLCEEIYHILVVRHTIEVAKWIVLYIYKYKVNVLLIGVHKKDDFIASDVFKLMVLLEVESELQTLEISIGTLSNEWGKPLNDPQVAKFLQETKFIDYVIHSKDFWRRGKVVAKLMQTLFQAHCLVHFDAPTIGYLYEMMERVQNAVEQCRECYDIPYDDIWELFEMVKSRIIHPIHAAAAFLNPIYLCGEKFMENDEMKKGVNDHILEHIVGVEEKEAFKKQEELYRMKDSNVFTVEAMQELKKYHPRIWWKHYGTHLPVLQKYAIRILSQPCSSSICRGYQLDSDTDDTFKKNTKMMGRCKSLEAQSTKPIIFDELGEVSDDAYNWENEEYLLSYAPSSLIEDIINDKILNDPTCSKFEKLFEDLKMLRWKSKMSSRLRST